MKKVLCLCVLFASLAMAGEGPNLKVPSQVNLDAQTAGVTVETTLTLKNDGDAPLTIAKIKTPCGCTTTKIKDQVLQPGESAAVPVTIRTARLKGNYDKTLHVLSDDPDSPKTPVRIQFEIQGIQTAGL